MPWKDRIRALLTCLRPAYWQALIVVSLLYFARFDASFITLRAKTVCCYAFSPECIRCAAGIELELAIGCWHASCNASLV